MNAQNRGAGFKNITKICEDSCFLQVCVSFWASQLKIWLFITLVFILMCFSCKHMFLRVSHTEFKHVNRLLNGAEIPSGLGHSLSFFYGQLWPFGMLTLRVLTCSRYLLRVTVWKTPVARSYWACFKQPTSNSRSYMVLRRQSILPLTFMDRAASYWGQIPSNSWPIVFKVNFR